MKVSLQDDCHYLLPSELGLRLWLLLFEGGEGSSRRHQSRRYKACKHTR